MKPEPVVHTPPPTASGEAEMQRDMDSVRDILIRICDAPQPLTMDDLLSDQPTEAERETVNYYLKMLVKQAKFVSGEHLGTFDGEDWMDLNLTWDGHEFLDSVRDPEIWRQTKAGAQKVGSWSIKTLADIAVAIGKARIEQLFATGQIGG